MIVLFTALPFVYMQDSGQNAVKYNVDYVQYTMRGYRD